MEVHHHAHHEEGKGWKSYIREFLMLFLAVFCGFLAEWRLEQMIEHHREEEYMHSIVEDINADVEQTDKLMIEMNNRIVKIDSLLITLALDDTKKDSKKAFRLWLMTLGFQDFVQNDRTIQQLKSSGSLRLIRNKAVSDKIMEYDQTVRAISVTQSNMNSIAANTTLFNQTFDFIALNKPNTKPIPLTEIGQKMTNETYASRFFWRINLVGLRRRLELLNKKGKEVAAFVKQEYHIK